MFHINDYIYDPKRLIFYKHDLPEDAVKSIQTHIDEDGDLEQIKSLFNKLDPNAMSVKMHAVRNAGICLTSNCQLRCNYCNHSSNNDKYECLSPNDVEVFIKEIIKRRKIHSMIFPEEESFPLTISFTGGGEPTYYWNLFVNSVNKAKALCFENDMKTKFLVTTNGFLNSEKLEFLANNFDEIMVSYDGLPNIQNTNRKNENTAETNSVVEYSMEFFNQFEDKLSIRTTIWPQDFHLMKSMADYIFGKFSRLHEWSILPVIPAGRALDTILFRNTPLDYKQFFSYFVELAEYIAREYPHANFQSPFFNQLVTSLYCGLTEVNCYWLLPDKHITHCSDAVKDEKIFIAEIKNDKIEFYNRYKDPCVRVMKEKIISSCQDCIAFRFCKGGCPLKWLRKDETQIAYKKAECDMQRDFVTYIFRNILSGQECFGWKCEEICIEDLPRSSVFSLKRVADQQTNNIS